VLESIGLGDRLHRGRSLARAGSVLSLEIAPGEVRAEVKSGRQDLHHVRIAMEPIPGDAWQILQEILSRRAIFVARLLAGEMPPSIEEAFAEAGLTLFPSSAEELEAACDCADPANPCPHAAAVFYLLAERFDEDPFQIFFFRGRGRTELLGALREHRAPAPRDPETPGETPHPPSETGDGALPGIPIEGFWDLAADLDPLNPRIAPPAIAEAVLRRLGPPPGAGPDSMAEEALHRAYGLASVWALRLAMRDEGTEEA
jgi:uncharacterized Zn finger protein